MSMIYYPENIEKVADTFGYPVEEFRNLEDVLTDISGCTPYFDGSVFFNTETERLECYAYVTVASSKAVDDWDGVGSFDMSDLNDWKLIELMDRDAALDISETIIEIEPHPELPLIYGEARDA